MEFGVFVVSIILWLRRGRWMCSTTFLQDFLKATRVVGLVNPNNKGKINANKGSTYPFDGVVHRKAFSTIQAGKFFFLPLIRVS